MAKHLLVVTSLLFASAALSGCAAETTENSESAENTLALVKTADGGEVRFYAEASGELSVESKPSTNGVDPLARLDLDNLRATEVYEALTSEPAPVALRDAEARAALTGTAEETADPGSVAEGSAAIIPPPMSALAFQRGYCGSSTSFCDVNISNDQRYEKRANGIHGFLYCVQGPVVVSIRRRVAFNWHQVLWREVLPGGTKPYEFDQHWGGLRHPIKLEIKNATGDRYHLSFNWASPAD